MNNELQQFIQETLRQIQAGTVGHLNMGDVDFEIAIAKTVAADGKIGVSVLGIGTGATAQIKTENVSKVKFSTRLKGAMNKIAPMKWP